MRRFFIEPERVKDDKILLEGELAHHINHVLRMTSGEEVTLADGCGHLYHGRLSAFGKDTVTAEILSVSEVKGETKTAITLYQGMPKGDKLELIIQKCTELGVDAIVPVFTKRSVVKLDSSKAAKKTERWQKIAQEASQQSKRITVPTIRQPLSWTQLLDVIEPEELTLVLWEDEATQGLKTLLEATRLPERINLIIGPEGGLEEAEVQALKAIGAHSTSLGKRILRTETAGLAALTMVLYHTGDLG